MPRLARTVVRAREQRAKLAFLVDPQTPVHAVNTALRHSDGYGMTLSRLRELRQEAVRDLKPHRRHR